MVPCRSKKKPSSTSPTPKPASARFLKLVGVCIGLAVISIIIILVVAVVTAPEEFDTEEISENDLPLVFGVGLSTAAVLGAAVWSLAPTDYFSPLDELDFDVKKNKKQENGKNTSRKHIAQQKRVSSRRKRARKKKINKARRIKRTRLRNPLRRASRATRVFRGLGGRLFSRFLFLL